MTNNTCDAIIFSAISDEQSYLHKNYSISTVAINARQYSFAQIGSKNVALVITGVGTTNAAAIMADTLNHITPKAIYFAGSAGSINQQLTLGDVVIGEQAFEVELLGLAAIIEDSPFADCLIHPLTKTLQPLIFQANQSLLDTALTLQKQNQSLRIFSGKLATTNFFPAPKELFHQLQHNNSLAIDMESSALYQIGWLFNIPCLAIRAISNTVDVSGTDDVSEQSLRMAHDNAVQFVSDCIKEESFIF